MSVNLSIRKSDKTVGYAFEWDFGLHESDKARMRVVSIIAIVLLFSSVAFGMEAGRKGVSALEHAESALEQFNQLNYAAAERETRIANEATPDDPSINKLTGAILLYSGNAPTAIKTFNTALMGDPQDSLALYGLGLAKLATGDLNSAVTNFDRSEAAGGDKSILLMARRYAQYLSGAQISVGGAALSDSLTAAQHGLQGMQYARSGDWKQSVASLETGLNSISGDAILQAHGLLMTFEKTHPLDSDIPKLNPTDLMHVSAPKDAFSGSVELSPKESLEGVSYASYELDGKGLGLVNVAPFRYNWDTLHTSNGTHTLTIMLYDRALHELGRSDRKVFVFNHNAEVKQDDTDRRSRLDSALWQTLTLLPDRCCCDYTMGIAHRAMGEIQSARFCFERALALNPMYRDARQQWLSVGGSGTAGEAIWGGPTNDKVIAFTFDDGPKPGVTEPLLDLLIQERIPATFFVIGRHVMEYPELTRKITDAGMEIANHSYTHKNLKKLSEADVSREILQTQAAIQTVTGKTPRFVRPPGGNWNDKVAKIARSWGMTPCMWTVDVYGSEVISAQQVARAVLTEVKPGSVILMHNGKMSTLQALPTIIRELRKRGYTFVTVDTMARRLGTYRALRTQAKMERPE